MKKAIICFLMVYFVCAMDSARAATSDIAFSEIMYDALGADKSHEWVELYYGGQDNLLVTTGSGAEAWRFFDGSNHTLKLVQGTSTLAQGDYLVLADNANQFLLDYPSYSSILFDTVMSLANTSSTISLSFDGGDTYPINTAYNNTWGGAGDGYSLEKIDLLGGELESNWRTSFVVSGTPGLINSTSTDNGDDGGEGDDDDPDDPGDDDNDNDDAGGGDNGGNQDVSDFWSQIIISELLPNPIGSDNEEWIEIYNDGAAALDLSGFGLQDNSARQFILSPNSNQNYLLAGHSYLVIAKKLSGISLNNTGGDAVKIFDPNGELLDSIEYKDKAPEGRSMARQDSNFVWTTEPSPGSANIFVTNLAPQAVISLEADNWRVGEAVVFDASSSTDPEEGDLEYHWDFGDGQSGDEAKENHIYKQVGSYLVALEVKDSGGLSHQASQVIEIGESALTTPLNQLNTIDFALTDLMISEFIANPTGSDDNEWIELYNASAKDIDLLAWQLDDSEGGSSPYTFATSTIIKAGGFLVVNRVDSGVTLNNNTDQVRLLTPLGSVWQSVDYDSVTEGQSLAWDLVNQEWFSGTPSPEAINLVTSNAELILSVNELADLEKNEKVLVRGVVLRAAHPTDKSIYVATYDDGAIDYDRLLEIYSYNGNLEGLKSGQVVTARGALSRVGDLPRLKIATAEDIIQNDIVVDTVATATVGPDDIDEDSVGSFVGVQGFIVKKSGQNIYLASTLDSEAQLRVYSKYLLKDLALTKGQEIVVSGLLSALDSGFKLSLLDSSDIALAPTVLGEQISDDVADKNDNNPTNVGVTQRFEIVKKYLLYILALVALLALLLLVKKKQNQSF